LSLWNEGERLEMKVVEGKKEGITGEREGGRQKKEIASRDHRFRVARKQPIDQVDAVCKEQYF
jgi:hypothetical protein